jgi:hypothetical protein
VDDHDPELGMGHAEWYTDPADPYGTGTIQAFMPNQHNTCGVVTYQVKPSGGFGPTNYVAVNQAQSGWVWVYQTVLDPASGAKLFLPDGQTSCPAGRSMSVDATLWTLGQ